MVVKLITFLIVLVSLIVVVYNNFQQLVISIDSFGKLFLFLLEACAIVWYLGYNRELLGKIVRS
jgi:hypothetical protein